MSVTSIRLSEELKMRVAKAADRAGTTAHNYILEAIEEKVEQDRLRNEFHETADARFANIVATGKTISWNDMRRYLESRVAGGTASRPVAKKIAR